jgi:hypothetical protein
MVNASRQQYKPYTYNLVPENLVVEMDVDDDEVLAASKGNLVITMDGFSMLLTEIATSIDNAHEKSVIAERKKGRMIV